MLAFARVDTGRAAGGRYCTAAYTLNSSRPDAHCEYCGLRELTLASDLSMPAVGATAAAMAEQAPAARPSFSALEAGAGVFGQSEGSIRPAATARPSVTASPGAYNTLSPAIASASGPVAGVSVSAAAATAMSAAATHFGTVGSAGTPTLSDGASVLSGSTGHSFASDPRLLARAQSMRLSYVALSCVLPCVLPCLSVCLL